LYDEEEKARIRLKDQGKEEEYLTSSYYVSFKNFIFSTSSRPALGPTQPLILWVPVALTPGVKQPGREAGHSPPTSAEVKKM
jgi:hypothetical protein